LIGLLLSAKEGFWGSPHEYSFSFLGRKRKKNTEIGWNTTKYKIFSPLSDWKCRRYLEFRGKR
jgi:hypothetical protein